MREAALIWHRKARLPIQIDISVKCVGVMVEIQKLIGKAFEIS